MKPHVLRRWALATGLVLVAAACADNGGKPGARAGGASSDAGEIAAEVASYDLVAGRTGRFIVGLLAADKTRLIGFGTVELSFTYLGTRRQPTGDASPTIGPVKAGFLPIPGQHVDANAPGPRFVSGSEATGVYGAYGVRFDRPGFWQVRVGLTLDGRRRSATAAFQVLPRSDIPAPGDPAPRTRQPLVGDPTVAARAIDSRAGPDRPVPDPELHSVTIADAIAAGRPLVVVVSTPTFCVSRFCGPITDMVSDFARRYGDRVAFAHLEVWQDFEAGKLNPWAAEWIFPPGAEDAREPWVFVVGRNGIITDRFDNVTTADELEAAIGRVLAP